MGVMTMSNLGQWGFASQAAASMTTAAAAAAGDCPALTSQVAELQRQLDQALRTGTKYQSDKLDYQLRKTKEREMACILDRRRPAPAPTAAPRPTPTAVATAAPRPTTQYTTLAPTYTPGAIATSAAMQRLLAQQQLAARAQASQARYASILGPLGARPPAPPAPWVKWAIGGAALLAAGVVASSLLGGPS